MADIFKRVKVPKAIAGMLYGTKLLCQRKQSRWKRLLTPTAFLSPITAYSLLSEPWGSERLKRIQIRDMASYKT